MAVDGEGKSAKEGSLGDGELERRRIEGLQALKEQCADEFEKLAGIESSLKTQRGLVSLACFDVDGALADCCARSWLEFESMSTMCATS